MFLFLEEYPLQTVISIIVRLSKATSIRNPSKYFAMNNDEVDIDFRMNEMYLKPFIIYFYQKEQIENLSYFLYELYKNFAEFKCLICWNNVTIK